jgi:glycosyltransferase 2 family protein
MTPTEATAGDPSANRMKAGWVKPLTLIAKLGITVALLWWLSRKLDLGIVLQKVQMISVAAILLSVVLTFCGNVLAIVRWNIFVKMTSIPARTSTILRYGLVGCFFNQALPSSLGGDGIRFWLLYRDKVPASFALRSIFLDRLVGFALLLLLSLYGLPRLLRELFAVDFRVFLMGLACCLLLGAIALKTITDQKDRLNRYRIGRLLVQIVGDLKLLISNYPRLIEVAAVSVLAQLTVFCVVWILVREFDPAVSFVDVLTVTPVIFILLIIPISIAGWGLREGLFLAGLGLIGVSHDAALISSILFGLVSLAASLIGGVIWIFDNLKVKRVFAANGR